MMKNFSHWLLIVIGLSVSTTVLLAQISACNCVFAPSGTKCLPRLSQFTCEDTCKADLSPGITVRSATPAASCDPPLHAASKRGLLEAIGHSIGHQGAPVYRDGSAADTLLNGQGLRDVLLSVQQGDKHEEVQRRYELTQASLPDIEAATRDALQLCKTDAVGVMMKTKLYEVWAAEDGPNKVKRNAKGMFDAANLKHYQDIRSLNFGTQGDDRFKGRLACFSGTEVQKMIDEFVQKSGIPASVPAQKPVKGINTHGRGN